MTNYNVTLAKAKHWSVDWLTRLARRRRLRRALERIDHLSDHMRQDIGVIDGCGRTQSRFRNGHPWV